MTWTLQSWRARPIEQQPDYDDADAVESALDEVRALPPLVAAGEVDRLRLELARAARGEAFVLQGGDCAERFSDCTAADVEAKLKILLQMSLVLTWTARVPVVRVGRIAGQYAKPRSSSTEVIDGVELPSYRGDHVNAPEPTPEARRPDPRRLVRAYFHSAATLNYVRALLDGGFADLHHPHHWDLGFVRSRSQRAEYEEVVERMLDALDFFEATGAAGDGALRSVDLYSSHEGLLLPWEEAQTVAVGDRWYNLGAHMLWIGDRTRQLDGAHVEFFRGVSNPIGVKVGPGLDPAELPPLLDVLDPDDSPGRVALITRLGADAVAERLPKLRAAVDATGRSQVVWICDPMHGNTQKTGSGRKTRAFDDVRRELQQAFDTHQSCGGALGGVHFELTGDDVTECIGGAQNLSEADLELRYQSFCDPRLNYAQSLEMAFEIAKCLSARGTVS